MPQFFQSRKITGTKLAGAFESYQKCVGIVRGYNACLIVIEIFIRHRSFVSSKLVYPIPLSIISVRCVNHSITHIFSQGVAEMDVGQPGHAPPQHHVAGRRVSGSVEISSKLSEPRQEVADGFLSYWFFGWN
jgi:hypothetical protein